MNYQNKKEGVVRESIPVPPDTSLMLKLGIGAGYSFTEAGAELADNSIDARLLDKKLMVRYGFHRRVGRVERLVIEDNGCGMSKEKLIDAMTLAKSSKEERELGKFGLGLKTGSLSLGRAFSVRSAAMDMPIFGVDFNERSWTDRGEWKLDFFKEDNPNGWHGTIVEIHDFRVDIRKSDVTIFAKELADMYRHFIESDLVEISVQDIYQGSGGRRTVRTHRCSPTPLEFVEKEVFARTVRGGLVEGFVGVLLSPIGNGRWGFNTYRNKKIVEFYSKIGLGRTNPEPSDRFIYGEVHMSHVPVTTTKREWIKNSTRYKAVDRLVRVVAAPLRDMARTHEKDMVLRKKVKKVPYNRVRQLLKRAIKHFRKITSCGEDIFEAFSQKVTSSSDMVGAVKVEKRQGSALGSGQGHAHLEATSQRRRVPKKVQEKEAYVVRMRDREFQFILTQIPQGPSEPWKSWVRDEGTRAVHLFVNTAHFIWVSCRATSNRERLLYMIISETLSEILCEDRRVTKLRDSNQAGAGLDPRG